MAVILNFSDISAVFSIGVATFGENRSISNELATVFRYARWQQLPPCISVNVLIFDLTDTSYIGVSHNIPIKFGEDWSNGKEMATVFQNSKMVAAAILNFVQFELFQYHRCVLYRIRDIKFAEDWSGGNEMATVLQNPRWWPS